MAGAAAGSVVPLLGNGFGAAIGILGGAVTGGLAGAAVGVGLAEYYGL